MSSPSVATSTRIGRPGLTITTGANGERMLAGLIQDKAALRGLLVKIRDLGLPLIALQPLTMDEAERRAARGNDPYSPFEAP